MQRGPTPSPGASGPDHGSWLRACAAAASMPPAYKQYISALGLLGAGLVWGVSNGHAMRR
jgi:hypothetical protein